MSDNELSESGQSSAEDSAYLNAIHEFETALDAGQPLSAEQLLQRYPNVRERLNEYLQRRQKFDGFVGGVPRPEIVTIQDFAHYHIGALIDCGGNASIHQVQDQRFYRDAALKVPLKSQAADKKSLRRLEREAQLSGRLQHPHIVPVYDVGTTETSAGQLPYFTMRLIEGKSLSKLLAERGPYGGHQFEYILLFQQICQAIGYAHGQGIIHRDLKPGNVMVGAFHDAYVMDWGFARDLSQVQGSDAFDPEKWERVFKNLNQDKGDSERTILIPGSEDSLAEAEGLDILGTPAYLPPEIARGGVRQADKRSDVFCLGGILCSILTGMPVFQGDSGTAALQSRAGSVEAAFARLDSSQAPSELIALAKDCLAAQSDDRPTDANSVAARVKAYIDGQEQAKLEAERKSAIAAQARADAESEARRQAEKSARAERRAKWLTMGLALSALIGISTVVGLKWREVVQERAREVAAIQGARDREIELQRRDIQDAVTGMFKALDRDELDEAGRVLQRAQGRIGSNAPTDVRTSVSTAEKNLAFVLKIQALREEADILKADPNHPKLDYLQEHFQTALGTLGLSLSQAEITAEIRKSPIRNQIIWALDYWASLEDDKSRKSRLIQIANASDLTNSSRAPIRAAALTDDATQLRSLIDTLPLATEPLATLQLIVDYLPNSDPQGLKLLRAIEGRAMDQFWFQYAMATRLMDGSTEDFSGARSRAAVRYAHSAYALRPRSEGALFVLSRLYYELADYPRFNSLLQNLPADSPSGWMRRYQLGIKAHNEDRYRAAAEHFLDALKSGPQLVNTRLFLASCYQHLQEYPKSLKILDEILRANPQHAQAWTLKTLCLSSQSHNRASEMIPVLVRRCQQFPDDFHAIQDLGVFLCSHGRAWEGAVCLNAQDRHNLPEKDISAVVIPGMTRGDWEEVLKLFESPEMSRGHSGALNRAMLLCWMGKFQESQMAFKEMVELSRSANAAGDNADADWIATAGVVLLQSQLKSMLELDQRYPHSQPIPRWSDLQRPGLTVQNAMVLGDFFHSRQCYVVATQAYEQVLKPKVVWPTISSAIGFGTDRVRAAAAAAQASIGGGRDALRATEIDRHNYRQLAFRWVADELRICRTTLSRKPSPLGFLVQIWDGGDQEQALTSLNALLMYKRLEPIRSRHFIADMNEEDRQTARRLWREAVELYRMACPPIDLPVLRDRDPAQELDLATAN